ncbi:MAG: hypothetical protein LBM66_06630, partial [Bifidobacteriaceae bacterium]|nr:hypothetical protein [Bifidobacteriaceae bacterium]
ASVGAILTCVVAFAGWKPARRAARARADVPTGRFSGQLGRSVVANLAGCALTVGYPTVMSLMVSKTAIAHAAGLLFAISMTRALLLLPLNVFQPMLISHFVSARGHGTKLLAALWGIVAGAGAVIAAAVALIGPFLLRLLAKDYQLSPGLLAALTLGAAAVTLAVATGALALSLGAHTAYMVGWIVAVAVSAAALALPLPLNTATVVSLLIGPVVGALIHSAAIARRLRVPMAEA